VDTFVFGRFDYYTQRDGGLCVCFVPFATLDGLFLF